MKNQASDAMTLHGGLLRERKSTTTPVKKPTQRHREVLDEVKSTPVDPRCIKHTIILKGHEGKGSETITATIAGNTSKVKKEP